MNAEQKAEITALKSKSSDLKNTSIKEIEKIDNLEQYGRRQNLDKDAGPGRRRHERSCY